MTSQHAGKPKLKRHLGWESERRRIGAQCRLVTSWVMHALAACTLMTGATARRLHLQFPSYRSGPAFGPQPILFKRSSVRQPLLSKRSSLQPPSILRMAFGQRRSLFTPRVRYTGHRRRPLEHPSARSAASTRLLNLVPKFESTLPVAKPRTLVQDC